MSDQIPVWLKPTPGKVLTSLLRLKTAAEQSRVRQEARMVRNADKKGKSAKDKAKARQRQTKVGQAPRLAYAARSPGLAARWRVSLVARQRILHYFQPNREPAGVVSPSILVVYGQHCRLENISQTGTWLRNSLSEADTSSDVQGRESQAR